MSRVVQVANFVAPRSGGLRTALAHLAAGYASAGHEVVQVVPGPRDAVVTKPWGRRVVLRGPAVPGTGYRLLASPGRVQRLLEELRPDRLEVHDRTTLRGLGGWARSAGVPSLLVSHERLDAVLSSWLPGLCTLRPFAALVEASEARLGADFDVVVATTAWAAVGLRVPADRLVRVPLGVDLATFSPGATSEVLQGRDSGPGASGVRLAAVTRLSREKRPGLAVATAVELVRRGADVSLDLVGDGPLRRTLESDVASGAPVRLLGHLHSRRAVAAVLARADVVLAPGPVETFGLAALEALACGTPVVVDRGSALPEVVGPAGVAAAGTAGAFADGVEELLARPRHLREQAARARAETFRWDAAVEGFLRAHRLPLRTAPTRAAPHPRSGPSPAAHPAGR